MDEALFKSIPLCNIFSIQKKQRLALAKVLPRLTKRKLEFGQRCKKKMNEKKHKGTNAASVHKSFQQQIVPRCVHYLYIYFGRKTIKISEKSVKNP